MNLGKFFAKEEVNNEELEKALKNMQKQIDASGGELNFILKINDDGWVAQCKEFEGIITGGPSTNPSEKEIIKSLLNAIKTAFDVPINDLSSIKKKDKKQNKYPNPKIKLTREVAFG